jgi:hypothetical protein
VRAGACLKKLGFLSCRKPGERDSKSKVKREVKKRESIHFIHSSGSEKPNECIATLHFLKYSGL